eukprot:9004024-Heterocapsa_arctica.AAC.1
MVSGDCPKPTRNAKPTSIYCNLVSVPVQRFTAVSWNPEWAVCLELIGGTLRMMLKKRFA